jgi:hypothetical protein
MNHLPYKRILELSAMKSRFTRTTTVLASAFGLALFVTVNSGIGDDRGVGRGFGRAGAGPGFNSQNNPGLIGRQASDSNGAPGFNSTNNPGTVGSQFGRSTAQDASATGLSHRNSNAGSFTFGKPEETVVNTASSNANVSERATTAASSKPETSSRFSGSLLNAGITPIPSATPSRGINPVPSATPGGRPPVPSPIPSATVPTHPPVAPGISPIPSATPGGEPPKPSPIPSATVPAHPPIAPGISPIPSATPGGHGGFPAPSPVPNPIATVPTPGS